MASNVVSLKKRMDTVETVSKITKAMKLISITRYQKYRRLNDQVKPFVQALESIPSKKASDQANVSLPVLNIFIGADLGLASAYINRLIDELKALPQENKVLWIGSNQFERVKRTRPQIINDFAITSDGLDVLELYKRVLTWSNDYNIQFCYPSYEGNRLTLTWETVDTELLYSDLILYEPSFQQANNRYQSTALLANLYQFYYQAKSVEYMMRRVAMDQASDNAGDMKEKLQQEFNRIRQEEITLEIQELSTGGD